MLFPFPTRHRQTPTESFIVNLPADIWPRIKNGELIFELDEASGVHRPPERARSNLPVWIVKFLGGAFI
jgi:hypothetical protein